MGTRTLRDARCGKALCQAPSKWLQRTVQRHRVLAASASFHSALAARWQALARAAEPERHAARFAAVVFSLVFTISSVGAAAPLESVELVNGGAVLVFGNSLRLRCTKFDSSYFELVRKGPNPRLLVDGRIPTHQCDSAKVDVE